MCVRLQRMDYWSLKMNLRPCTERVFLLGAMRSGTTSLYHYLAEHPDIFPSPLKEPRFFCMPSPAPSDIRDYESLYAGQTRERWSFEASTHYTRYPTHRGVPERIRAAFPEARFIYIVRHPVERIASAYLHWRAHGRERRPFEDAVFSEPSDYLNMSRYHMQLEQYWRVFPRNRILVLVFESFIKDTVGTVKLICEFLDVDPTFESPTLGRRFNESASDTEPGTVLTLLRRAKLHERMPWRVRSWANATLRRSLPERASLVSASVRGGILERLEDDLTELKGVLGDRLAAWDLSRP
ncbi:MAG TPA: sulfotransferase [Vicinamibacterales bacterium]|nr:sulfotransferase [Vicinamibacterales bacterium]